MRIKGLGGLIGLALVLAVPPIHGQRLTGFSAAGSERQRQIEAQYKAIPKAEEARRQHRFFTSEPHPAGSERNNQLAFHIAEEWKRMGWEEVKVHRYDVLNTFPREVSVEMVAPIRYQAGLREDGYDVDPDTKNPNVRGGWIGMSRSGDITAPVVYAHSGNPEDYELLRKQGIDVRGKIVLVRYSVPYSYRGFKALTAERMGAAAILIYSDPAEDGYQKGKVFPEGPWGPESHIQRGAITYDFIVPGDPLTPGWASVPGAKQVPAEESKSLPKIIAAPLSWRDAKPLLENMDGPVAPKSWQGGLPIKYRLGGNRVKVHLKVDMDNSVRPNYVVEARMRGSELPDEWVVMGNHRDAWEFGGVDPSSGTASMMELARAFGELKQKGIRPRRTLVLCSWDGEEVGLTGSTEWGEHFADQLRTKAVAYINVDSSTSGPDFGGNAVASLGPVLVEVSKSLDDPAGKSLYEAWRATVARNRKKKTAGDEDLVNTRIGSGSDHTVFLNHLGVPTIDMSFDGPYGVYHSVYDNFYWMNKFGDPGYRYHRLMAQLWGALALRLANAEISPFAFDSYGNNLKKFVNELMDGNKGSRQHLDIEPLLQKISEFTTAGKRLGEASRRALESGELDNRIADRVNRAILDVERNWLNPEGIPHRPWFKHMLYAARYTYAHLELPGITEAVEAGNWKVAQQQTQLLSEAVAKNTRLLNEAAELLETTPRPGPTGELKSLEDRVETIRRRFPGEMAVYMKNLATSEELASDADTIYETFSVIKIPIMAEVLRQAEAGKFALSDRYKVKTSHARWPSGVLYAMDAGLSPTIKDLLTLMIIISDNSATDILGDLVGRDQVTRTMASLGLKNTTIEFSDLDWDRKWLGSLDPQFLNASAEKVMEFPFGKYTDAQVREAFGRTIWDAGIYFGHSTARETGRLLEILARKQLVSESASELMLGILRKQQVDNRFPRYLRDTGIAHKTGDGQPFLANDAGILWVNEQPIVLVVFTARHRGTTAALHDAIASVAAYVAKHYGGSTTEEFRP